MIPASNLQTIDDLSHIDQRVRLQGIRWEDYEAVLAMRGEKSGTRITYLKGVLELMSPSADHESLKTMLARLLEAYADARGIELQGYGSWTVKSAEKERGFESDECYILGVRDEKPVIPDIAIEVVWTSGGIDKLEVYRGFGVPEVWFWQNGALRFFVFQDGTYLPSPYSRLLPELDPVLIARFMGEASQTQAVRAFRAAIENFPKTAFC